MTEHQREILLVQETDIDGALYRFGGNEKIYISCLSAFLDDTSMQAFRTAMETQHWDDARIAVHTLKGAAGNMGFVPLMKAAEQMVAMLRSGRYREAEDSMPQLERQYRELSEGITAFLADQADHA